MGSSPFRSTTSILSLSVCVLLAGASFARAQDAAPAHIAVVDGAATLEREQGIESATPGELLVAGDRVRSTGGRLEILFADGSVLDVDENTTIDFQSDTLLRLSSGRVLLTVIGVNDPASAVRYQIDTPVASAITEGPGEYRVAVLNGSGGPESEIAVLRGRAGFTSDNGSISVRAGERSVASDRFPPSYPQIFNSARIDAFDRWTSLRRSDRLGTVSTQYLPRDLYSYSGELDRSGSWGYEPTYGNVWYPTVAATWRPYYDGYWTSVTPYGWTWVGLDAWTWPTHHYGRWGVSRSRWFWIPDRHWSPAWVSWASSPGYVSWCPLGFDNRPLFSLSIGIGNPGWGGWVVVPHQDFGPRRVARQYAIASPNQSVRSSLVQNTAPALPARAVPRQRVADARTPSAQAPLPPRTFSNADVDRRAIPRQGARSPIVGDTASRGPADNPVREESPLFKRPLPGDARGRQPEARTYSTRPDSPAQASPSNPPAGARSSRDRRPESAAAPSVAPLSPSVRPLSPSVPPLSPSVRPVDPDARSVNPYRERSATTRPGGPDSRNTAPPPDQPPDPRARVRSSAPRSEERAAAPESRATREAPAPAGPASAPAPRGGERRAAPSPDGGGPSSPGSARSAAPAQQSAPPAGARSAHRR